MLSETVERKIFRIVVDRYNEEAILYPWGPSQMNTILLPVYQISLVCDIPLPKVFAALQEMIRKGVWTCHDCRQLEPLVSFVLSPRNPSEETCS